MKAVTDYLNGGDWELIEEFVEIEIQRKTERPKLEAALTECHEQKATLVIAKLGRLSRNVTFLQLLRDSQIEFTAVDMPEANLQNVGFMAVIAKRDAGISRLLTTEALAAAKASGVKLGNPRGRSGMHIVNKKDGSSVSEYRTGRIEAGEKGRAVTVSKADQFATYIFPVIETIQSSGTVTLQGIADELNNRDIKTSRGGIWHPTSVKNIINRKTKKAD